MAASHQRACLAESEARFPRAELRAVPVSEIAEEIRLDVAFRKELLIAPLAFLPGAEEFLVQLRVVESRHGTAVETQRACRHDQIGSLQRRVAPGGDLHQ